MEFDGRIYSVDAYINNRKKRISENNDITDEGEKLFGKRISPNWNKKPVKYYELTIKNLSYNDAHIFHMKVVYQHENGPVKTDNTSSINLEIKGELN